MLRRTGKYRVGDKEFSVFKYRNLPEPIEVGRLSREACGAIRNGFNLRDDPLREIYFRTEMFDEDGVSSVKCFIGYTCGYLKRDYQEHCKKVNCPIRHGKHILAQEMDGTGWERRVALIKKHEQEMFGSTS